MIIWRCPTPLIHQVARLIFARKIITKNLQKARNIKNQLKTSSDDEIKYLIST